MGSKVGQRGFAVIACHVDGGKRGEKVPGGGSGFGGT